MRADAPTSRLRQARGVVVGGVGTDGDERGLVHRLHDGRDQPVPGDRGDGRRAGGHVREKAPTVCTAPGTWGRRASTACVITPSAPSEPIISAARS